MKRPPMPEIPNWRKDIKTELLKNLGKISRNFTVQLYLIDIKKEAVMYSCNLCLEFKRVAPFLPPHFVENIANQVCDVMISIIPEFTESERDTTIEATKLHMEMFEIEGLVNNYYNSVR